jgi:hypothetical protein
MVQRLLAMIIRLDNFFLGGVQFFFYKLRSCHASLSPCVGRMFRRVDVRRPGCVTWRIQIPDGGGPSAPFMAVYVKWDRSSSAFLWGAGLRIAVPHTPGGFSQCLAVDR